MHGLSWIVLPFRRDEDGLQRPRPAFVNRLAIHLVKLPENRGLWLTYAKYLTPAGEPIHGRGLEPDTQVEEPDVEFGAEPPDTDPILDAALARLAAKKAA